MRETGTHWRGRGHAQLTGWMWEVRERIEKRSPEYLSEWLTERVTQEGRRLRGNMMMTPLEACKRASSMRTRMRIEPRRRPGWRPRLGVHQIPRRW